MCASSRSSIASPVGLRGGSWITALALAVLAVGGNTSFALSARFRGETRITSAWAAYQPWRVSVRGRRAAHPVVVRLRSAMSE